MAAAVGFGPTNIGVKVQCLQPLGYAALVFILRLKLSDFSIDFPKNSRRFNITTVSIKFIAPSIKPGKYHFLSHNYIPLNKFLVREAGIEPKLYLD